MTRVVFPRARDGSGPERWTRAPDGMDDLADRHHRGANHRIRQRVGHSLSHIGEIAFARDMPRG